MAVEVICSVSGSARTRHRRLVVGAQNVRKSFCGWEADALEGTDKIVLV
jgi:hypothetical protein